MVNHIPSCLIKLPAECTAWASRRWRHQRRRNIADADWSSACLHNIDLYKETTAMQFVRATNSAALFLLLGTIVSGYAQQDQQDEKRGKSERQQGRQQQGAPPPAQQQRPQGQPQQPEARGQQRQNQQQDQQRQVQQ